MGKYKSIETFRRYGRRSIMRQDQRTAVKSIKGPGPGQTQTGAGKPGKTKGDQSNV